MSVNGALSPAPAALSVGMPAMLTVVSGTIRFEGQDFPCPLCKHGFFELRGLSLRSSGWLAVAYGLVRFAPVD